MGTVTTIQAANTMVATVVPQAWAVPSKRSSARSANALIRTRRRQSPNALSLDTKAMACVMTVTTIQAANTMVATVVPQAWAVLSKRSSARSANALIRTQRRQRPNARSLHTKAMACVMTVTTIQAADLMEVIVAGQKSSPNSVTNVNV